MTYLPPALKSIDSIASLALPSNYRRQRPPPCENINICRWPPFLTWCSLLQPFFTHFRTIQKSRISCGANFSKSSTCHKHRQHSSYPSRSMNLPRGYPLPTLVLPPPALPTSQMLLLQSLPSQKSPYICPPLHSPLSQSSSYHP